jgi:DNA repair protein RecO (recombination protein O)
MLKKVEGVVIRSTDYGEGNKIINLYTRELGKIPVMVRGARKSKSRFAVSSQLFTYGEYMIFGSGNMPSLNQVEVLNAYSAIQKDLFRMSHASYIIEMLYKLTEDRDRNPFVFELLKQTLDHLSDGKDVDIVTRIFEIKMLALAGVRPELNHCVSCQGNDEPYRFSVREGGLLCVRCYQHDSRSLAIHPSTAKLLRLFQYFDLKRLGNIEVKDTTRQQLNQVIKLFMDEHVGLQLKTRQFIEQLHRYDL